MLGLRLLCGVPLFFVMVGLLCLDAHCRVGWTLAGLLALFTVFGVREFCHFSRVLGNHPFVNWATAFGVLLFLATEFALSRPGFWGLDVELATFTLFVCGAFLIQLTRHRNAHVMGNLGSTVLSVGYFWFFLAFVLRIRHLDAPGTTRDWAYDGLELVFVFFTASKICDIAGLIVGRTWGRHKLWPEISPKKSWEGFLGGMLACMGLLAFVIWLHDGSGSAIATFGYAKVLPLGILLSVFGLFGDLCESAFKREAQLKDAGGSLPGYGGAMDMLDSLTFNAPIAYYYFIYVCGAVEPGGDSAAMLRFFAQ